MTIGEKIKELRKKNDLTQEKLADYLCISYQAVSKWETGISSPDLSVIGPLTKLLHVSADELLGLNEAEPNKRRVELEAAYEKSWITGDLDERLKIVEAAVNEYPGDLKYLNWLASTTYYRAMENLDYGEEQDAEIEKSIKIHERVIEECTDTEVRCASLVGIIVSLSWLKRYDEAKKYVELYPEKKPPTRDDLLWYCLTGEEQIKYQQKIIKKSFADFIWQLNIYEDKNASKIAEQVIKLMIPDGNYLDFHSYLFDSISNQALELARKGQYDESVVMLEKACYHANKWDRIMYKEQKIYNYTAPFLNRLECNTYERMTNGTDTLIDSFYERLTYPAFNPMRDRDDFKKLAERKMRSE